MVIVDSELVYSGKIPPPLLNRFEKQYLGYRDLILSEEAMILSQLAIWLNSFSNTIEAAFIGYHEDNLPAIVMSLRKEKLSSNEVLESVKKTLLFTGN